MTSSGVPVLSLQDLAVHFPVGRRAVVKAVDGVSFDVMRSEVFGLIGESGSGKSTVGRAALSITAPTAGAVLQEGVNPQSLSRSQFRKHRQRYQMVFQDPHGSLNPRMTVMQSIAEPIVEMDALDPGKRRARVLALLDCVGLAPAFADRYPHQLSGGQKQRVNIARALASDPKLIVCDEAVAALDVSVQAGILNLLLTLQKDLGLTYLFITHDIGVVSHISDRLGVMYLGKMVEIGPTEEVEERPLHPYTKALLASEPGARRAGDGEGAVLEGEIPSAISPPSGCRFRTRCRFAVDKCVTVEPPWREVEQGRFVACHLV